MDIKPIRNDDDLRAALAEIERLWESPVGSPEGDRLEVLTLLVEKYEETQWPAEDFDPVDLLRYACAEMGRSQSELATLLGSRSRASEIMARKRPLTLDMIRTISAAWHLPVGMLAKPYELAGECRRTRDETTTRPLPLDASTP
jgi:HTH-type transcriptional regulator/antitoxin HigA